MATFIDFESRKHDPPALLGVLSEKASGEPELRQWILDPGLATAKVARPHLHRGDLSAVAETLATAAEQDDRSVVGWSLFDHHRIVESPHVSGWAKAVIDKRYVNAITIAKRWRRRYLPDWKPDANELKGFFAATGFKPKLRRDIPANPADWIKHAQDQIATRGSYGAVTDKTKRDWHRLLVYNEDDCRGLKHVFDTATREVDLWESYEAKTFRVNSESGAIDLRVGWRQRTLDRWLERRRVTKWAFVSAANPSPGGLPAHENEKRHRALIREVERAALAWTSGLGIGGDAKWPAEESLLIPGCSEARAVALGRAFGQLAVVAGRRGEPARLRSCRIPPRPA